MDTNEKTIWKKDLFSHDDNEMSAVEGMRDGVEDLDIIKIQRKLNKINKRKKYMAKPIEGSEIFNSMYDPFLKDHMTAESSVPSNTQGDAACCGDGENMQEGFKEGLGRKKKKHPIDKTADALNNWQKFLYNVIFFLPDQVEKVINSGCATFTEVFSNYGEEKSTEQELKHDTGVVTHIVYSILSFPLCLFISYNWFFLLAYQEKENSKIDGEFAHPSSKDHRIKIEIPSKWVNFFGQFCIYPLQKIDWFVFDIVPLVMDAFTRNKMKIIVQFAIIVLSFEFVSQLDFFGKMKSSLSGIKFVNPINIICGILIAWQFIKNLGMFNEWFPGLGSSVAERPMPITFALLFCAYVFYVIVIMLLAVFSFQISAMIVLIYFWFHSIFGILIYGNDKGDFMKQMDNIDKYIKQDLKWLKQNDPECHKDPAWKKVLRDVMNFLFDNIFYLVYFWLIGKNVLHSYSSIESAPLKNVIGILLVVQLILIALLMWNKMRKKPEQNKSVNRFTPLKI
jgi:hypothetical protein